LAIDYEITFEDIRCIKSLLIEFVSEYEKFYYQYDELRLSACLSTFYLLLHLHESISDCGPACVFWQFPCEPICGMLKPMVKNRSTANRNLVSQNTISRTVQSFIIRNAFVEISTTATKSHVP
jgi:hypothetical protein